MIETFKAIEGMDDGEFIRRQKDAVDHVKNYFNPVTEERMCQFV